MKRWTSLEADAWGIAVTAGLAGLGALANAWLADERLLSSTTWLGALKVFAAAVAVYVTARKLKPTKAAVAAQTTTAALVVGLVLSGAISCKPYVPPILHPVVDCVTADRSKIESLIASLWPGEAAPNWPGIKDQAIDAGISIGGCAFAELLQRYLAPPPGTAVPPAELAIEGKETFEAYRAGVAGGASFRTQAGDL